MRRHYYPEEILSGKRPRQKTHHASKGSPGSIARPCLKRGGVACNENMNLIFPSFTAQYLHIVCSWSEKGKN